MALDFPDRPDAAKIVALSKEASPDGGPCQVLSVVEFTKDGVRLKRKPMILSPGVLRHWLDEGWLTEPEDYDASEHGGEEYALFKFDQLYNAIPEVAQSVLDTVSAQIPQEAFVEMWK